MWTSLLRLSLHFILFFSLSLSPSHPSSSLSLLAISPQHLSLSLSLWPHILLLLSPHCSLPFLIPTSVLLLYFEHRVGFLYFYVKLKDGQSAPVSFGGLGYFSFNLLIAESETSPHLFFFFFFSTSSSSLLHCLSSVTRPLCADGCDALLNWCPLLKQCDLRARPSVSAGAAGRSLTTHRLVW